MLFFKKKKQSPPLTPPEIAERIFGNDTTVTAPFCSSTAVKYPFLSHWGSNAEADYHVQGKQGELDFEFSFPLKIYTSEMEYKIHHYGFWGSCLTLRHPSLSLRNTYAFSGKPFRAPDDEAWLRNDKFKGLSIWSEHAPLTVEEMAAVKKLISWVESGMSAIVSVRYAVFCKRDTVSVVFWEPELYDFESQLEILRDYFQMTDYGK